MSNWTKLGKRIDAAIDARLRKSCRVSNNRVPIVRITGDSGPTITGEPGGHFTKGGDRIAHPTAYSRRGWSNIVYACDTRVITVGAGFRFQD